MKSERESLVGGRSVKCGDVILLRGKSLKGKNRVREHGDRWLVREVDKSVLGRNLGLLLCPASYIGTPRLNPRYDRSGLIHQVDGECRWIKRENDSDFEIIEIAE